MMSDTMIFASEDVAPKEERVMRQLIEAMEDTIRADKQWLSLMGRSCRIREATLAETQFWELGGGSPSPAGYRLHAVILLAGDERQVRFFSGADGWAAEALSEEEAMVELRKQLRGAGPKQQVSGLA
ncbi:hypothetical protein RDV64_19855 [Acuticoccus sp. MNP-M23]|uniref:hypothetical protein n=1 Tax=Acuticoccus sp. MNP-M23 TaxID=3072793 RepID=UPI002815EB1B|nr:hypothetical protein [Acuticoccus sp. MNP-M23]WMS42293.1 hypothetical protein RDV64_19855 [Acuticoccus sp. MNP-M23]